VLPESLVRRLIRKKISSKYEILKEENLINQKAKAKKKAEVKKKQEDKEKIDKIKDVIPSDGKKTAEAMPPDLVTAMEDELKNATKNNSKIEIYDKYIVINKNADKGWVLPDNHQQTYNSLKGLIGNVGGISFHERMYNYANEVKNNMGITIILDKFDDINGAIQSTRRFSEEIRRRIISDDISEIDNKVSFILLKNNILNNKEDYGIIDTFTERRIEERQKVVMDEFITLLTSEDNLTRLLSETKFDNVKQLIKIPTIGQFISIEHYGTDVLGAYGFGTKTAGKKDYFKRLGELIRVLFLPKSKPNEIAKAIMEKEDKIDVLDSLGSKKVNDIKILYNSRKEKFAGYFNTLLPIYNETGVDEADIINVYKSWYELMDMDSSDLVLTRMMALLLSKDATTWSDWGWDAMTGEKDADIEAADLEDPLILFKAVKKSLNDNRDSKSVGWAEIVGAHLGAKGQNVQGKTKAAANLESAYETIGLSLYSIWKLKFNKNKAMKFFSPNKDSFPPGEEFDTDNVSVTNIKRVWDAPTSFFAKSGSKNVSLGGTGLYYEVMMKAREEYRMIFVNRESALQGIKYISNKAFGDAAIDIETKEKVSPEIEKDLKESKIFRSKDGSKILVERKDLRKLIKALKNSRRK
jgi:hypothetical protein